MGDKVGENPAALRAAVFLLSAKNRRGGCSNTPPSRAKVNILSSYLTDRQQMTKVDQIASNSQFIRMGVPQGSILGPLLFIIYINDICNLTNKGTIYLFADDTAKYIKGKSSEELQTQINEIVPKLEEWFHVNRLSLNATKTNYQIYSRSMTPDLNVVLNDTYITRKPCVKYLDVHIDENLKWSSHISSVTSVISRNVGVMARAKYFLSPHQLLMLYNALLLPHLNYCAVIWGRNYETAVKKLLILQKRALRIIDKKPFLHPSKPLFIKYKVLRIRELVIEQSIMILLAHINKKIARSYSKYVQVLYTN